MTTDEGSVAAAAGRWHPRLPELAAVANAVSVPLPALEPYIVRTVRRVIRDLPEPLRSEAKEYARQEAVHGSRHRAFNATLRTQWPIVARAERATAWLTRRIEALPGTRFHTGFAAGFEAVAFEVARWCAPRLDALLDGADEPAAALFVWHLAEESEHRGVALDVHRAVGGRRASYALGLALSFTLLALSTWMTTLLLLIAQRRIWHPLAWIRLIGWGLSFLFFAGPGLLLTLRRRHQPMAWQDPPELRLWLAEHGS